MKKITSSLFLKIGILLLPFVLGLSGLVLVLTYNITYENILENSKNTLCDAAVASLSLFGNHNMYTEGEMVQEDGSLSTMCDMFNITYLYALSINVEQNSETYLAIGFGENASQDAMKTRYPGVTVTGALNDEQIAAFHGDINGNVRHDKNQFDDSLVCYIPCTYYYDADEKEYISYDNPIVIGAEISLNTVNQKIQARFNTLSVMTIIMTLLMLSTFAIILYFKVTKPLRRISDRMTGFITDREKGIEKLLVKGNDELAQMASSFNTMTDEINQYIDDIDVLTRDKHKQEAELDIARKIQRGLLQPEQLRGSGFDITAYMLAAKDVGGDLYDYRILDDGRIFVAIADVSGKGISAALFMAHAITILQHYSASFGSPAQLLTEYNNSLLSNNPGGMFITTFVAFYDPGTRTLTYSNAGHNIPYILSEELIPLTGAHGVASGLFEGEEYEDASVRMNPGDTLFLYTDGVNEAKNLSSSFYETERLEKMLRTCSAQDDVLSVILQDLNSFTEGAEQNDDITMLCLRLKPEPSETVLRLSAELPQLNKLKEEIVRMPLPDELKKKLMLAAEEIFVNICSYAYDTPAPVEITITRESNSVSMTFTDSGKPFDPTADLLDIDEYDHENAIGGLGRFLTFSIADRYQYRYQDGKNILWLGFEEG